MKKEEKFTQLHIQEHLGHHKGKEKMNSITHSRTLGAS